MNNQHPGDPVTASDVAPVPPLVDVIEEVLEVHWTFSTHGDFDALADRCDGCHADIFTHGHGADQKTAWAAHQARAVLTALTEAGNVEWGVESGHEPIDHVTEADNQDAAIAESEDRKAIGIPSRAVSRITWPWTEAEA